MMNTLRRNKLAFALSAALGGIGLQATSVHAVNFADDGIGDVLIYQYYANRTVANPEAANDRWSTLFHVINTSADTVAVKVNFREANNSRDVLDFVLVLSPWDVWTGFTADLNGAPVLRSNDDSCISSPSIEFVPRPDQPPSKIMRFRQTGYTGPRADTGPTGLDRTREGYVEMINLGQAQRGSTIDVAAQGKNCDLIRGAFLPNNLVSTAAQFNPPDNVLKGNAYLVNFARGQAGGYDPVVLANFSQTNLVGAVNSFLGLPDLSFANPAISVVRDDTPGTAPRLIMDQWTAGEDAVSAVLTRNEIHNEWAATDSRATGVNNITEWVVTFPTKRFYVDSELDLRVPPSPEPAALAPFTNLFPPNGRSCHNADAWIFDREERGPDGTSPPLFPVELQLCNEVNVLTFRADELGTQLNSMVPVRTLIDGEDTGANTIRGSDLPVVIQNNGEETYFGYLKMMFDADTDRFFDSTNANANAGLGSDERADQAYNDDPQNVPFDAAIANTAGSVEHPLTGAAVNTWTAWCAGFVITVNGDTGYDFNLDGVIDGPTGANPPIPNITGDFNQGVSGLTPFSSTLTLAGYQARPYLSGLTGNVSGPVAVDTADNPVPPPACDNLVTAPDETQPPLYLVNVTEGWATYAGYPVTGFMMSFRTRGNDSARNYATALEHGYSRNIDVGILRNARFNHPLGAMGGNWQLDVPTPAGNSAATREK